MRKFMIIGLGGSGGKTLAFLMDELRFNLGPEWQDRGLPKCWQFVHIDVPTVADGVGKSLASPVQSQGGTYVGLADAAASYQAVDQVVFQRLRSTVPPTQDHLARWRPNANQGSAIAIGGGAGAYRAIGRMVTLSQSAKIINELTTVITKLNSPESTADLAQLNSAAGVSVAGTSAEPPIVLMVSSMAGGSGASMVLDIADLLRGLTGNSGFNGDNASAFLYTAEVFGAITSNAGAGTLATISELQSAMLNRVPWTAEEWNVLGTNRPVPTNSGRGPHAIFPVGAKSHGVPFGNTPEDVYRGFSKMLAPMMLSESLQVKFYNYVVVNGPADAVRNPDFTRVTGQIQNGTQLPSVEYAHFMGWGSATLTTGRKRYLEYASQRLAREAARVLVEGHGVDSTIEANPVAKKRQIAENFIPTFMRGLPLGADPQGNLSAKGLMDAVFPAESSKNLVDNFRGQLASVFQQAGASGGMAAAQLLSVRLKGIDEYLLVAKQQALQGLQGWAQELQAALENEFLNVASIKGLEIADIVLAEAKSRIVALATRDLAQVLSAPTERAANVANRELAAVHAQKKAAVLPTSKPALMFLGRVSDGMSGQLRSEIGRDLVSILPDFAANCLSVLMQQSEQLLKQLMNELSMPAMNFTTAAYREAPITDWPKDENVPGHFKPAVNEVMLDSVTSFPGHFWSHVSMTIEGSGSGKSETLAAAAKEILTGASRERDESRRFKGLQGWRVSYMPSHEFIGRRVGWMPRDLAIHIPDSNVSQAVYHIDFDPVEILEKSRKWVDRPGGAFSDFASIGIREWTYPSGLADTDPRAADLREAEATNRLLEAVNFASPLVEIDDQLVNKIHGEGASGLKYEFSDIPFTGSENIIAALQSAWNSNSTAGHNSSAVRDALKPISEAPEIVIFSTFASPYSIGAFKSLTQPIRNQWLSAKASGATSGFWDKRRARPLRNFVPMSSGAFQAFVTGWVVGRISGHIQVIDNPYGQGFKSVEVYSTRENRWIAFPSDPDLLGVNGLGLQSGSPALDQSGWNIPAALLESFGLALSNIAGMDLSPLDPYWAVVDLGLSLKHVGVQSSTSPLEIVLQGGHQPHGKLSQLSVGAGTLMVTERRSKIEAYLNEVRTSFGKKIDPKPQSILDLEGQSRSFEIAREIISAAQLIESELEFLENPIAALSESSVPSTESEPEA